MSKPCESESKFNSYLQVMTQRAIELLSKIACRQSTDFELAATLLSDIEAQYYCCDFNSQRLHLICNSLSECWMAFGNVHKAEVLKLYAEEMLNKPIDLFSNLKLGTDSPNLLVTSDMLKINFQYQELLQNLYTTSKLGFVEDVIVSVKDFEQKYATLPGIMSIKSPKFWCWSKFALCYKLQGAKTCIDNIFMGIDSDIDSDTDKDLSGAAYKVCAECIPHDASPFITGHLDKLFLPRSPRADHRYPILKTPCLDHDELPSFEAALSFSPQSDHSTATGSLSTVGTIDVEALSELPDSSDLC